MKKTEEAVEYMISVWDEVQGNWREHPDHVAQKFIEAEKEIQDQKVREHIDSALPDEECVWKNAGEYWATECDGAFYLETGTPSDNKMIYCPYCGKKISCA